MGIEYSKYGSIYDDLNYHIHGNNDTESDTENDTESDTKSDTESDTESNIEIECYCDGINKELNDKIQLLQDHINNLEKRILKLENSKLRYINL